MPAQPFNPDAIVQITNPHHVIQAKRTLSCYVNLSLAGGYTQMQSMRRNHQWITEFAFNSNKAEETLFADALFATYPRYIIEYQLESNQMNASLVRSTVNHFKTQRADVFIENEWHDVAVASINTPGVLRAMLFQSKNEAEMNIMIILLTELDVAQSLRQYNIASMTNPQHAAESVAKLFTSITHFYKAIHADFGRSLSMGQWNREWFNRCFTAYKNNQNVKALRETAIKYVEMCDATIDMRKVVIPTYEKLIKNLRSMVLEIENPRDIPLIRDMINEVKNCHGMQALVKGVPMPIFQPEILISTIEKVEKDMQVITFIMANEIQASVEPLEEEEEQSPEIVEPMQQAKQNIDSMMQLVTSALQIKRDLVFENIASDILEQCEDIGDELYRYPSPAEVLEQTLSTKTELAVIQDLTAVCATELQNLMLEEALHGTFQIQDFEQLSAMGGPHMSRIAAIDFQNRKIASVFRVAREVRRLQQETTQATIELQTAQYDQQRRSIRREVKRIREVRETVIRQMLPFFAEQLQQRAVHEAKQRAKEEEKRIHAVAREVARLQELVSNLKQETATLLEQHASRERRRMFHAVAPVFLPTAMYEADVDCGLCLQTLDWKQDIGYVACCPEYGYVCACCMSKPHAGHSIVIEREIVRIVRGVRRAAGV